jgi:hypothetical protein
MMFSLRRYALTVNGLTAKIDADLNMRRGRAGSRGCAGGLVPKPMCYKRFHQASGRGSPWHAPRLRTGGLRAWFSSFLRYADRESTISKRCQFESKIGRLPGGPALRWLRTLRSSPRRGDVPDGPSIGVLLASEAKQPIRGSSRSTTPGTGRELRFIHGR